MEADLLRCMASSYKIDSYQQQYFVIDSLDALQGLTASDFTPLYQTLARQAASRPDQSQGLGV